MLVWITRLLCVGKIVRSQRVLHLWRCTIFSTNFGCIQNGSICINIGPLNTEGSIICTQNAKKADNENFIVIALCCRHACLLLRGVYKKFKRIKPQLLDLHNTTNHHWQCQDNSSMWLVERYTVSNCQHSLCWEMYTHNWRMSTGGI